MRAWLNEEAVQEICVEPQAFYELPTNSDNDAVFNTLILKHYAQQFGRKNKVNLCRLIYCSKKNLLRQGRSSEDLISISSMSNFNNARDGITGALLTSPAHFFQVMEGSFDKINSTMSRIRQDDRHEDIELLQIVPVEQRFFGEWAMAVIDLKAPGGSMTANLLERVHAGQRQFVSVLHVVAFKLAHNRAIQVEDAHQGAGLH